MSMLLIMALVIPGLLKGGYWQENQTPTLKYLIPIELTYQTSGIEGIDSIYVINLDRRVDRMERMYNILTRWGLYGNRVSACDGRSQVSETLIKELVGPYDQAQLLENLYGPPSSAVACLLSHLSVIRDAYERGFDVIWVLEDDIEVFDGIQQIPSLLDELSSIDPEWDLFYTDLFPRFLLHKNGYNCAKDMKTRSIRPDQPRPSFFDLPQKESVTKNIDLVRWRTNTYSMIISKKGIMKILDYFSHVYLFDHIDRELHLIPEIRLYSPKIDIVTNSLGEEAQKSDIKHKKDHK